MPTKPIHLKNGQNYSGYDFTNDNNIGDTKNKTVTFTSLDNSNTTDKTDVGITSVATLTSGETHQSLFGKISGMFKNIRKLWNTVGTTSLASGKTLTGLMGSTAIPSSLGTTVTGAIDSLNSNYANMFTTLYTNPNISSDFQNQTITLNDSLNNYRFIAISDESGSTAYGLHWYEVDMVKISRSSGNILSGHHAGANSTMHWGCWRSFYYASPTTLTFDHCYGHHINANSANIHDENLKVYKIYGIK